MFWPYFTFQSDFVLIGSWSCCVDFLLIDFTCYLLILCTGFDTDAVPDVVLTCTHDVYACVRMHISASLWLKHSPASKAGMAGVSSWEYTLNDDGEFCRPTLMV